MRWLLLAPFLLLAGVAAGQHTTAAPSPADPHQKQPSPPPLHRPHPELPPLVALAHLRTGNQRCAAARADGEALPAPAERPAGAGRFVVGVIACADAGLDVPTLLGLRADDVLLISNAGATASADAIELLRRAVTEQRLSLIVVLSHGSCRSLDDPTTAAVARSATARALAERRRLALPLAFARLQCERIAADEELRPRLDDRRLLLVPATVDRDGATISWHTHRADELPIAPVR